MKFNCVLGLVGIGFVENLGFLIQMQFCFGSFNCIGICFSSIVDIIIY